MIKFTAYSNETGMVLYSGTASNPDSLSTDSVSILLNSEYAGGWVSEGIHYEMPAKPADYYTFNYTTKQWEDLRTLQEVKDAQWEVIKAAREVDLTSPLPTPYGTFDATISAQKSITDAILLLQTLAALGNPQNIDFTLADNTTVTLTTPEMVEVGLILGARTQELYGKARGLRTQIDVATTFGEVEAVTWS